MKNPLRVVQIRRSGLIGGLAGIELAVRGVGSVSIVNLLELLGEGALAAVAASTASGWLGSSVGAVAKWSLYALVLYLLIPRILPEQLEELGEDRVLVLSMAVVAVVFGNLYGPVIGGSRTGFYNNPSSLDPTQTASIIFILSAVLLWVVIRYRLNKSFSQLVPERFESSTETGRKLDKNLGRVGDSLETISIPLVLASSIMFFRILVGVLSTLYPLPEILLAGTAIFSIINKQIYSPVGKDGFSADSDMELTLGKATAKSLTQPQGMTIAESTLLVIVWVATLFIIALSYIPSITGFGSPFDEPFSLFFSPVTGAVVLLFLSSVTFLWTWIRIAKRSGYYIEAYNHVRHSLPGSVPTPETPRPVGGVLVALMLTILSLPGLMYVNDFGLPGWVIYTFAVLWVVPVPLTLIWVYKSIQTDSQPAFDDHWIINSTHIIILIFASIVLYLTNLTAAAKISVVVAVAMFVLVSVRNIEIIFNIEQEPWATIHAGSASLLILPLCALILVTEKLQFEIVVTVIFSLVYSSYSVYTYIKSRDGLTPLPEILICEYNRETDGVEGTVTIRIVDDTLPETSKQAIHNSFTEASADWAQISSHPSVRTVYTTDAEPRPWVAVERGEWRPLTEVRDDFTNEEIESVVGDLTEAIRNAHDDAVTHLDLQPEHVLVRETIDGVDAVVDDWGLKRRCKDAADRQYVTPYTPPELLDGTKNGSRKSDIYGLGATVCYILTGEPPVEDTDDLESVIRNGDVRSPSELNSSVPPALDNVVLEALATDPENRVWSDIEFHRAVSEFGDDVDETISSPDHTLMESKNRSGTARDPITRREYVEMAAVGGLGVVGFTATRLGGANDVPIPDSIEYLLHSINGILQWTFDAKETVRTPPAVAGGRVYVANNSGKLYALNAENGDKVWQFQAGMNEGLSAPLATDDVVCTGISGFSKTYGIDTDTGEQLWDLNISGRGSPGRRGDTIFINTPREKLVAVDMNDGATSWTTDLPGSSMETAVSDGRVFAASDDGLHAFDPNDGSELWRYETARDARAPTVKDGTVYFRTSSTEGDETVVYALQTTDGAKRCSTRQSLSVSFAPPPVSDGALFTTSRTELVAIDTTDGSRRWATQVAESPLTEPSVAHSIVYVGDFDGTLHARSAEDGGQRWQYGAGDLLHTPTVSENKLFVGDDSGRVYAIGVGDRR